MASTLETILQAWAALFESLPDCAFYREDDLPEEIKTPIIVMSDGTEEDSFRPLGGFQSIDHIHVISVQVLVPGRNVATRNVTYDAILTAIDTAVQSDATLGGLITGLDYSRPLVDLIPGGDSLPIKQATLEFTFTYTSTTPLN